MSPVVSLELVFAVVAIVLSIGTASWLVWRHFPLPPSRNRIGCVDGLRGYLALSVLFHHFILWTLATRLGRPWGATEINLIHELGAGAVGLFFMITGLLFYPTIRRGLRHGKWLQLYVRRVFRIVPLVIVSVVAVTAIIMARTGRGLDAHYPIGALSWITAKQEVDLLGYPESGRINAHVLWSLHYEWFFYILVLPVCAAAMEFRGRLPTWSIPVGVALVALVSRRLFPSYSLPVFLPLFASGMLAYELQERAWVRDALRTPAATALAVAALIAGMTLFRSPYDAGLPLFAFVFACVAAGNSFFGLLETRPSLVLGECSYGVYLLHGIVLSLLFVDGAAVLDRVPTMALPALLPFVAAVVVLVTALTHFTVERPGIALGAAAARLAERWATRLPWRGAGAAAVGRDR